MIEASSPGQSGELLKVRQFGETVQLGQTGSHGLGGPSRAKFRPKRLSGRANVMAAASPTPLRSG